jgi:hypothetical protein
VTRCFFRTWTLLNISSRRLGVVWPPAQQVSTRSATWLCTCASATPTKWKKDSQAHLAGGWLRGEVVSVSPYQLGLRHEAISATDRATSIVLSETPVRYRRCFRNFSNFVMCSNRQDIKQDIKSEEGQLLRCTVCGSRREGNTIEANDLQADAQLCMVGSAGLEPATSCL